MDEQRRRPDPTSRPDPYELAMVRARQGAGPEEEDGPPPLPRLHVGPFRVGSLGLLVGFALLVAVAAVVRLDGGDRTPELDPSCTQPEVVLSAERVRPGGLVDYAVRGADGVVQLSVRPLGAGAAPVQVLPPVTLVRCRASGRFGLQAPPGEHLVVVTREGREAATAPVTVTELGDPTG